MDAKRRTRASATIGVAVVLTATGTIAWTMVNGESRPSASTVSSRAAASDRDTVVQSVLGSSYSRVSSEPLPKTSSPSAGWAAGGIEQWKAPNGDVAQITWQPDNATLDDALPATNQTSNGNSYYIQHGQNGSVEIAMYGDGNAVIYTRADPNVSPNDVQNGIMVSDVPGDQTLIGQAAKLLAAS